jgi:hypothetical protein
MATTTDESSTRDARDAAVGATPERAARRKIPGNLPYTTSPGVLRRALEGIPVSEKPSVFNSDFVNTVLGLTGGASRPIIPIFKAVGLLSQSGVPTDLYSHFQTESGRATAALQALRSGFSEIFKRNQFAHRADENALTDLIVGVTGLPRSDAVVSAIRGTFQAFQELARSASDERVPQAAEPPVKGQVDISEIVETRRSLGLLYNINVVLPETTNIEVYNTIFRSLKANMLT